MSFCMCTCVLPASCPVSRVPSMRLGTDGQLSEFIEGLGQGQLVGRQVLATPALGDIQLSMCDRKNKLEVEVIRARGLQSKPGSRVLPGKFISPTPILPFTFVWR